MLHSPQYTDLSGAQVSSFCDVAWQALCKENNLRLLRMLFLCHPHAFPFPALEICVYLRTLLNSMSRHIEFLKMLSLVPHSVNKHCHNKLCEL